MKTKVKENNDYLMTKIVDTKVISKFRKTFRRRKS